MAILDLVRLLAGGVLCLMASMTILRAATMWQFLISLVATEWAFWFGLLALALMIVPAEGAIGLVSRSLAGLAGAMFFFVCLRAWLLAFAQNLKKPAQRGRVRHERLFLAREQVAECFFVPGGRSKPLIYVVHGGGWEGGTAGECEGFLRNLARAGCVVASGSYRLSPTHGWPSPKEDVVAGLRQILSRAVELEIDQSKVFLLGRSAGGQIASVVACADDRPPIAGCICLYAPFDLFFAYENAREDDMLKSPALLRRFLGGLPGEAEENYRSASAWHLVTDDDPPFLLIHGGRDDLVWVGQSRRFARRLCEVGVPCRYLELPWATHSFDHIPGGPGSRAALAAICDFVFSGSRS